MTPLLLPWGILGNATADNLTNRVTAERHRPSANPSSSGTRVAPERKHFSRYFLGQVA